MGALSTWVRNIVIYLLLMTLVNQLIPDGAYKKYMKVTFGLILMLIATAPLFELTHIDLNLQQFLEAQDFWGMRIPEFDMENANAQRESYLNNAYVSNLETAVSQYLESIGLYPLEIQVTVDEDEDGGHYGELQKIRIRAMNVDAAAADKVKKELSLRFFVDPEDIQVEIENPAD